MTQNEAVFAALASPVRREILRILKSEDLTAGDISAHFDISAPSVSRHLSVLKSAGLVEHEREGNTIIYRLVPDRLATTVGDFLSAVCPTQMLGRARRERVNRSQKEGSE